MASTVRRRSKPAGSPTDPDPRVEGRHVRFLRSWARVVNRIQREAEGDLRRVIVAEQERLGTRRDNITDGNSTNIFRYPLSYWHDASGDQPKSLRSVDAIIRQLTLDYEAEHDDGEEGAEDEATGIEVGLEVSSSTLWGQNITSLVMQAPVGTASERRGLSEFVISKEPNIPPKVRKKWIGIQLDFIKPVAKFRVQGGFATETINQQSMRKLRGIVTDGILQGIRVESIMREISQLRGITTRRAEFIARDQVVKQNGTMNRIRHQGIRVTHYTWQTVGDARVRDTHKVRQGKRYSYKRGPPRGLNPGQEPQCRCWASPDLRGALRNLQAEKRRRGDALIVVPRHPRALEPSASIAKAPQP